MENLIISFNAIMPMFLIMGLGCFIRNRGFMTEDALNRLNRTNFYFFLSAMCFQSAYTGDLSGIGSGSVILFCVIGILIEFFASDRWVGLIDQDPSHHAILMQSCFRSNTMLIGLPLAKALFDDVAIVVIVYAVTIPMYNFFGALAFEKDRGGKLSFTSLVLKNPLVISTLAGLLLNVLRVRLPVFLTSAVNTLSAMAGGLALAAFAGEKSCGRLPFTPGCASASVRHSRRAAGLSRCGSDCRADNLRMPCSAGHVYHGKGNGRRCGVCQRSGRLYNTVQHGYAFLRRVSSEKHTFDLMIVYCPGMHLPSTGKHRLCHDTKAETGSLGPGYI